MNKLRTLTATIALLGASVSGSAMAGVLDGVSILNITGIAESSMADSNMTQARATLTGEGATITDVAIGSFSAADLSGIDILYVGLVNGGFNSSQLSTITSFVGAGGGLVAVGTERACCYGPSWEQVANSFGLYGLGGDRGDKANPTTPSSPIVTGPFGTADDYAPAATGAFDPTRLPSGTTVVWEGVDNNPIIVTLDVTGRAFFFGDTNFMENGYIDDGDNRIIWGNAFAFTGQVDAPVPEPASWAMMIAGFGLVGGTMRARSRRVSFQAV
jgi:hypothetical protein